MQHIKIKNIPNNLKNTIFYKNLNIEDEENFIYAPIHDGFIKNSEDFLKLLQTINFWGGDLTSEIYKFIINNFFIWQELKFKIDEQIKFILFKDIFNFNSLLDLFEYSMNTDNLSLYKEFWIIRKKFFRLQDIHDKKGLNCYDYYTFSYILLYYGLSYVHNNGQNYLSLNFLKFLIEYRNEIEDSLEWIFLYTYLKDKSESFIFLLINNIKLPFVLSDIKNNITLDMLI